jgi:hypothetical protein
MSLPPWHAEIVELHNFFFGWLGGTLPATDAIYARLVDTMAPVSCGAGANSARRSGSRCSRN